MLVGSTDINPSQVQAIPDKHKYTIAQDHHILGSFGAVTTGLFLAIICRPSAL